MKRAALYIRVSTDEQAKHGFSLAEQKHDLEEYARAHHYTVVNVYADEGSSARKALNRRKGLQRLLDDVRAGQIDIILLKCLDRWFRNVRDFYKVQDVLDQHGVNWECTQEDYNTTTTNGRLMLNLKLSIAQNESDQTSDRIKYVHQGMLRKHEELSGNHPLGYEIKDKHLVIVEKERPIVEFIFQQILSGYSTNSISHKIYDEFGEVISNMRVWCMLRNATYKGTRYGIPNYCPAIIPPAEFDRAQEILSRNKRRAGSGRVILFSGKIICPCCGNRMIVKHVVNNKNGTKKSLRYICNKYYYGGIPHDHPDGCNFGGTVSESVIERYLVGHIRPLLEDYEASIQSAARKNGDIQSKIKSINAKLTRLKDLYVDGLIDKETYIKDHTRLQDELTDATQQVGIQPQLPPAAKQVLSHVDFTTTYAALPKAQKRELWQTLIDTIELGERPKGPGRPYSSFKVKFF